MRPAVVAALAFCLALLVLRAPSAVAQLTWQTLPAAPPTKASRHDDVWFVDDFHGWVVNGVGEIWHTDDGGESWTLQRDTGVYNRAVTFTTPLRGWVGTLSSLDRLYETIDGGVTWNPVPDLPEQMPFGICGMWAVDEQVVYAVGKYSGPAGALKTEDGGANWEYLDVSGLASTLVDCWFPTRDHGFVVGGLGTFPGGSHAVVLGTADGGATWESRFVSPRAGEWCWKISFPSPAVGYVSVERLSGPMRFLKTIDGGATWGEMSCPNANEQGIGFVTELRGWIGGANNPTYRTDNGGLTWNLSNFAQYLNRIRVLRPELAFAVGASIYRLGTPGVTAAPVGVPQVPRPRVEAFPNPFTGTTRITVDALVHGPAEIQVIDARGRKVVALFAGALSPGARELVWDGRDDQGRPVPAGTYLLWARTPTGDASLKLQKLP